MHTSNRHWSSLLLITMVILASVSLVGCSPRTQDLETDGYEPLPGEDWQLSTPAEQGVDPKLVAELYLEAADLETLYGLLVVKNGELIAERYFHGGAVERKVALASVTKSYTSA